MIKSLQFFGKGKPVEEKSQRLNSAMTKFFMLKNDMLCKYFYRN